MPSREWSDYSDDEPLPPVMESIRSRDTDPNILCNGSPWIKVPLALRRGKFGRVTVWVSPIRPVIAPGSLTDSGRSSDDSEYCPE
jgi:hypothetical protein